MYKFTVDYLIGACGEFWALILHAPFLLPASVKSNTASYCVGRLFKEILRNVRSDQ